MDDLKKDSKYRRNYNIYCDESGVENTPKYFVIGSIFVPRDQKEKIVLEIKKILEKYKFKREIKWNKVTTLFIDLYKDLVNYFASNPDLEFKCIVINKKNIDYRFHHGNKELAFYKFYYQLLRKKLKNDIQYYIFTDEKSRSLKPRFKQLNSYLLKFARENCSNINIKHMQEYRSDEIFLLQLSDLFTGAVFYANNFEENFSAKSNLVKYIESTLKQKLSTGTNPFFEKFNIFKWIPKKIYESN